MAGYGKELSCEHYGEDHLTREQTRALGLKAVAGKGDEVPTGEMRGKIFRVGYSGDAGAFDVDGAVPVVPATTLRYLRA